MNDKRLAYLEERLDKLTDEWKELVGNPRKTEYLRYNKYENEGDKGYFTIKSTSKHSLVKEVLKGA